VATWGDAKLVKRQRVSSRGGVLSSGLLIFCNRVKVICWSERYVD